LITKKPAKAIQSRVQQRARRRGVPRPRVHPEEPPQSASLKAWPSTARRAADRQAAAAGEEAPGLDSMSGGAPAPRGGGRGKGTCAWWMPEVQKTAVGSGARRKSSAARLGGSRRMLAGGLVALDAGAHCRGVEFGRTRSPHGARCAVRVACWTPAAEPTVWPGRGQEKEYCRVRVPGGDAAAAASSCLRAVEQPTRPRLPPPTSSRAAMRPARVSIEILSVPPAPRARRSRSKKDPTEMPPAPASRAGCLRRTVADLVYTRRRGGYPGSALVAAV
jgi:hypothetical protein